MAQQFVQAKISGEKVVVFLKPSCPYCVTAQRVLSEYQIRPGRLECVDISGHADMANIQDYLKELTGARTVPRVFIGDKCVGGGSDVADLHESGELKTMLQSIGALQ